MSMISPAFQDAVHDSQQCFRLLLKAISEPGKVVTLDRCDGFGSLVSSATQTLLAMADNATAVWLSPSLSADSAVTENIKFHIGSPLVEHPQQASFAVFSARDSQQHNWSQLTFNPGNEEYPDLSTTVIVELDNLDAGTELTLSGPGIESQRTIYLCGASVELLAFLQTRQASMPFPLGIDFIFVANQQVLCVPRTTKVEVTPCTLP